MVQRHWWIDLDAWVPDIVPVITRDSGSDNHPVVIVTKLNFLARTKNP